MLTGFWAAGCWDSRSTGFWSCQAHCLWSSLPCAAGSPSLQCDKVGGSNRSRTPIQSQIAGNCGRTFSELGERITLTENSPFRKLTQFRARNEWSKWGSGPIGMARRRKFGNRYPGQSVKIKGNHDNGAGRKKLAVRAPLQSLECDCFGLSLDGRSDTTIACNPMRSNHFPCVLSPKGTLRHGPADGRRL